MNDNKAYISLLTSQDYLLGLLALHASLVKTKPLYPLYVILSPDISQITENYLFSIGIRIIRDDSRLCLPIDVIESNKEFNVERWGNTLLKIRVFDLIQFSKIVFLDSDMMVLRNIDCLFNLPHMSSVMAGAMFPGNENWNELNSGLMVIVPKKGLFEGILSTINRVSSRKKYFGDQDLINEYYSEWYNENELHLAETYNVFSNYLKFYILNLGFSQSINNEHSISVVHFIGYPKPWMYKSNFIIFIIQCIKYFMLHLMNINPDKQIKLKYKLLIYKCRIKLLFV